MKTQEQIKSDLRFSRIAQIFLILLIVIMAVIAALSLIHTYLFGADKFNFVFVFAPSITAYVSYLALQITDKAILRLQNIPLKEE